MDIKHRTGMKLFNLRRFQTKTKIKANTIRDIVFSDDLALNASMEVDLQDSVDRFSKACSNFGLTINTSNMCQRAAGNTYAGCDCDLQSTLQHSGQTHKRSVFSADVEGYGC